MITAWYSEFLQEIVVYWEFTEKQAEAFIAFYDSSDSKEKITRKLDISFDELDKRLNKVYDNIGHSKDTNKIDELRNLLWKKYQHQDDLCIDHLYKIRKIRIAKAQKLEKLDFSSNCRDRPQKKLIKIPDEVFELGELTIFLLQGNLIDSIPERINNLTNLIKLDISRNQLTSLPKSFNNLTILSIWETP